jgi:hypothetical protein
MKIEIHIDNTEVQDIIDHLKSQGIDVTADDVQFAMEDYIFGAIQDSKSERFDAVVDSIIDIQD